jgi:cysteinylglycine-S-conjugate dipeptidase
METGAVVAALGEREQQAQRDLERLVEIPSVSAEGHDPAEVARSAEATAELLRAAGLEAVRLLDVDGSHPYVVGELLAAGEDAPTVLLYAHHDVQPVPTPERWSSPPFEPTVRGGRLYGRGTSDAKARLHVHAAAVRAWLAAHGALPVNVKVVIEGEEEVGSPHLAEFVARHADDLRADVVVATDLVNWKVGVPGLTYSLRGLAEVYVTVRALRQPVHSGMWGGPVPDALSGLMKTLASLTDERGAPAVAGLADDVRPLTDNERARLSQLDVDTAELRAEAGALDDVAFTGDPDLSFHERVWFRPAITVIGVDVPKVREASNQLISEATAKVSIRLAPGQDPDRAARLVAEHLRGNVPWGLDVDTRPGASGTPWLTDPDGPAFEAALSALRSGFGTEPVLLGCGGTIPFVTPMADALGGVPCLLTAVEDPHSHAHGEDESLHLGDFHRACVSEALLFAELAARAEQIMAVRAR